jgi:malonate-semialdehyde dehydrogenase (acetylating)/methylmalonate-semialdehyde dehydrogenase
MEGVRFWTKTKTITARWPETSMEGGAPQDSAFVIPTMR